MEGPRLTANDDLNDLVRLVRHCRRAPVSDSTSVRLAPSPIDDARCVGRRGLRSGRCYEGDICERRGSPQSCPRAPGATTHWRRQRQIELPAPSSSAQIGRRRCDSEARDVRRHRARIGHRLCVQTPARDARSGSEPAVDEKEHTEPPPSNRSMRLRALSRPRLPGGRSRRCASARAGRCSARPRCAGAAGRACGTPPRAR